MVTNLSLTRSLADMMMNVLNRNRMNSRMIRVKKMRCGSIHHRPFFGKCKFDVIMTLSYMLTPYSQHSRLYPHAFIP